MKNFGLVCAEERSGEEGGREGGREREREREREMRSDEERRRSSITPNVKLMRWCIVALPLPIHSWCAISRIGARVLKSPTAVFNL
jgi:hypothetical protein